jgi:uncharacterized repeat protein (TIGR03803 family)
MHTTKITRTLTLAGFTPAGKPSRTYCGLLSMLALFIATAIASPAQTYTTLFSFDGTDGNGSLAGLVQATNGDLYGTTISGGDATAACNFLATGCGTIFKITPNGTLTTLYKFCAESGCLDGASPAGGLAQATNGDFYGTTSGGGANSNPLCVAAYLLEVGCGTIFKITPGGTLTTLYSFCAQSGCTDGADPIGGLVQAANGDLYGTTIAGGANTSPSGNGGGTVFKITPGGLLTTLYSFCAQSGCADGGTPMAGLIQAANGDLYGTTAEGGANGPYDGTIFKITPSGTLTTLYSFCAQSGCADGDFPLAGLVQGTNGDLYGTTFGGGANCAPNGCGTVFKITPSGSLTTLYSFCSQSDCTDGSSPEAGLVQATDGDLYGTTSFNGDTYNGGTIFKITPSGTLTTLYSFCQSVNPCTSGEYPQAALVQDTSGNLYGTTSFGGTGYAGTIFSLSVGLGPFVETRRSYGTVGAAVEILGTDLTSATSVSFNGTAAAFTVVSPSLIAARVPVGATSGKVQVAIPSGTLSSNVPFRVLP